MDIDLTENEDFFVKKFDPGINPPSFSQALFNVVNKQEQQNILPTQIPAVYPTLENGDNEKLFGYNINYENSVKSSVQWKCQDQLFQQIQQRNLQVQSCQKIIKEDKLKLNVKNQEISSLTSENQRLKQECTSLKHEQNLCHMMIDDALEERKGTNKRMREDDMDVDVSPLQSAVIRLTEKLTQKEQLLNIQNQKIGQLENALLQTVNDDLPSDEEGFKNHHFGFMIQGKPCLGSQLKVMSKGVGHNSQLNQADFIWSRTNSDGDRHQIPGAVYSTYCPEPLDRGCIISCKVFCDGQVFEVLTQMPVSDPLGLDECVDTMIRQGGALFNVRASYWERTNDGKMQSIECLLEIKRKRLKIKQEERTRKKWGYSRSMQVFGDRSGDENAMLRMFILYSKRCEVSFEFENTRDRNAALCLIRQMLAFKGLLVQNLNSVQRDPNYSSRSLSSIQSPSSLFRHSFRRIQSFCVRPEIPRLVSDSIINISDNCVLEGQRFPLQQIHDQPLPPFIMNL